ncbi:unnamed protein product [Pedinophyceae sp. YPF-701]|nr:unnamed protein product [Pedinophyceae sp. YPF-701]
MAPALEPGDFERLLDAVPALVQHLDHKARRDVAATSWSAFLATLRHADAQLLITGHGHLLRALARHAKARSVASASQLLLPGLFGASLPASDAFALHRALNSCPEVSLSQSARHNQVLALERLLEASEAAGRPLHVLRLVDSKPRSHRLHSWRRSTPWTATNDLRTLHALRRVLRRSSVRLHLRELRVGPLRIVDDDAELAAALCRAVAGVQRLEELEVCGVFFSDRGGEALRWAAKRLPALRTLRLFDCGMTRAGVRELNRMLRRATTLTRLDVDGGEYFVYGGLTQAACVAKMAAWALSSAAEDVREQLADFDGDDLEYAEHAEDLFEEPWERIARSATIRVPEMFLERGWEAAAERWARVSWADEIIAYSLGERPRVPSMGILRGAAGSASLRTLRVRRGVPLPAERSLAAARLPLPEPAAWRCLGALHTLTVSGYLGVADVVGAICKALAHQSSLQELDFSGLTSVSHGDVQALADALHTGALGRSLRTLLLSGIPVLGEFASMKALLDGLQGSAALEKLDVSQACHYDAAGVLGALLGSLLGGDGCALTELILTNCEVGDKWAVELARGLRRNRTLAVLNLHRSVGLGSVGVTAIAEALGPEGALQDLRIDPDGPVFVARGVLEGPVDDDVCRALARAVDRGAPLRTLGLFNCGTMTFAGLWWLITSLQDRRDGVAREVVVSTLALDRDGGQLRSWAEARGLLGGRAGSGVRVRESAEVRYAVYMDQELLQVLQQLPQALAQAMLG